MKLKTILLISIFIMGAAIAKANNTDPGKKDDIMGNVLNESKKPLKDVTVTAYFASRKEKVVISDGCGAYSFDNLKPGVYKFVFEKDGYQRVVKDKVTVKVDEAFQLDIEMVHDNSDLMPAPSRFLYN